MGLQTRRSAIDYVLPALGLFGTGLLVGAGLGLLFAPRRGQELRSVIGHKVEGLTHRSREAQATVVADEHAAE